MLRWSQNPILDNSDYVEPKHHKTEILLDEPLRSLPNGICDEIVGNKVVRRTDKIVIDGTKRFNYSILEDNNIVRFWSSRDNLGIPKIKPIRKNMGITFTTSTTQAERLLWRNYGSRKNNKVLI